MGKKTERVNTFRVYVRVIQEDRRNKYKLLFVDPYHLAIPSVHRNKASWQVSTENFSRFKYCEHQIRDLLADDKKAP